MPHTQRSKQRQKSTSQTITHHLYGEIPLIAEGTITTDDYGNPIDQRWWRPDPTFQPPLPVGAVRGHPHLQDYCWVCHYPKYFYVDEEHRCIQCGNRFIFTAQEQQFWYETLKFNFHSKAIRCRECRRYKRIKRSRHRELTLAVEQAKLAPDQAAVLLKLAQTTVEFFEYHQSGNLERGIAAARRAFNLDPTLYLALYWQARCYEAMGHHSQAIQAYEVCLQALPKRPRRLNQTISKDIRQRKRKLESNP